MEMRCVCVGEGQQSFRHIMYTRTHIAGQTDTKRKTDRQMHRHIERQIYRQKNTDCETDMQTDTKRKTDKARQTGGQIKPDRHKEKDR